MNNIDIKKLSEALSCPSLPPGTIVEPIPIYFTGEPSTVDDTFEWFVCYFCDCEGFEKFGVEINWNNQINALIKQLEKVEKNNKNNNEDSDSSFWKA